METFFPLLVAALQVLKLYGLQHVRYTLLDVFHKDVLERLRKKIIRVKPDITDKWMLHHDNAQCHTVLSITELFTPKRIPVVPQPSYSPDLNPCDFFLNLKMSSKDLLSGL